MRRTFGLCLAGAITLALSGSAFAIAIPDALTQRCSDKIQNGTLVYINSVQKEVRRSIKNNINGKDSKCAAGFACSGGADHGDTCNPLNGNTDCTGVSQCTTSVKSGIASKIIKAKAKLRASITAACTNFMLFTLFGTDGTTRCLDPSSPDNGLSADELADCILRGAIGDIPNSVFGDPAGDVHGRGAAEIVPDTPVAPFEVCGTGLGSILSIGSEVAPQAPAEAGGPAPLATENCFAGVCDTKGTGVIGNYLTAPTQTFIGVIPVCFVDVTGNAGNGTPFDGSINSNNGSASTFSPISSTMLIGTTCPVCQVQLPGGCSSSPSLKLCCDSGPNVGFPCSNSGSTDTACPPTVVGSPPVFPNPLDLDTEPNTLSVPANNPGGGTTNPAGTFCGACDMLTPFDPLDDVVGCQNDQDCIDEGVCSGAVGSGCCGFGTNTGAFGNDAVTSASANGKRSQYLPQMATIFCTGVTGDAFVDGVWGLPGPVRLVKAQLNSYQY